MRLLNLLWLVCLFVLFDQMHPQKLLPGSSASLPSQKAEQQRLPVEARPIAVAAYSTGTTAVGNPAADAEADKAIKEESAALSDDQSASDAETSLPPAAPRRQVSREELCEAVVSAAQANNLPVGFLVRLIWQESGFDSGVVSSAGAQGLAQFMPRVAAEWGLNDPFDPLQALPASARLLRALHRQFGNLGLAAAAYNAGSGRIQNWLTRRGKLPQETRDYVMNITGHPAEKWVKAAPHSISFRVPHRAPCREVATELDAAAVPLPLPRLGPAVVTASAASDVKPLKVADVKAAQVVNIKGTKITHVAAHDALPKIAAPASIVAERAPANSKMNVVKVSASGKRQQLVLTVKSATAKSTVRAPMQVVAMAAPSAKKAPATKTAGTAKTAPKPAKTKTAASKAPIQLAMAVRPSKK
jgi:hypothetical protein